MKSFMKSLGLGILLLVAPAQAESNAPPLVASMDFNDVRTAADIEKIVRNTPWVKGIRQVAGAFDSTRRAWFASADLPFGQGSLMITLRREEIPADLAMTLVYEETTNADFIVQLWDAQDQIVAADLFSNILVAGREAKTDTFILDLARYPTASKIILRRLTGEIRIYGIVLTPVACEVPLSGCDEFELAIQLDRGMTADSPLVQATAQMAPTQQKPMNWESRKVQQPIDSAAQNPYARAALAAEDYPVYVPSSTPVTGELFLPLTASSLFAVQDMLRLLNAYHPQAYGFAPTGLTSADSMHQLFAGKSKVCLMSISMGIADRERFFRSHGHPVIELPAALDPILVVAHEDNPIYELTLPQLDAIFGKELRAGAEKPIRTWGDLGLGGEWANRSIVLWGGSPKTGTLRTFQRVVLQDGPFLDTLQNDPIYMYLGVIRNVANDSSAIGFCNAQHDPTGIKQIAVAPQTGLPAYSPTPEDVYAGRYPLTRTLYLYIDAPALDRLDPLTREFLNILFSRSGQEYFARRNQAPLSAEQVREIRTRLGL